MKRVFLTLATLLLSTTAVLAQSASQHSYTFHNATGNRYIENATGTFPGVRQTHIQFESQPVWVVGGLVNDETVWTVALETGEVYAVQTANEIDSISGLILEIGQVNPEQPISAVYDGESLPVLLIAGSDLSPLSAPVIATAANNTLVYIAANGDLVLWRNGAELDRTPLNIQPDGFPVISDDGQIAIYAQATDARYVHGIMGDDLEGYVLAVLDSSNDVLAVQTTIELPSDDVFEGVSPLWADVDDDGEQEIVTTVSNGRDGAWIRAYEVDGSVLAESRAIGQGFRWRHQLAVAPFGINGETQIVDVRTPHIGGMVEFFDLTDDLLDVNNAQLGYTSHVIGSRNLDQGIAADFNGNGKPELVVTDQARRNITAVENTLQGVSEVWRLPLADNGNTLTTNIAAVRLVDGALTLAAGADDNTLRIWR